MPYRLTDAREAERAIRDFWRARASYADHAALSLENARLRDELATAQAVNAALLGSRAVRAASLARRVTRRNRHVAPPTGEPQGPAFSVAMTVHNNGPCVRDAVTSVFAQTLPDWELLIWDDGTTDPQTLAVLDEIDSPRVRILRAPNQGVVGARNSVAQQARGEFLMFLDPDDELRPTYLEKALITFRRFPGVDIVIPSVKVESQTAHPYWLPAHFEEQRIAYENTAPISSVIRRSAWEATGGMSPEMAAGFEDWEFWRRCAARGLQGWVLDDALFVYRHSEVTGRDAAARQKKHELVLRIKQLNPRILHPATPIDSQPGAISADIASRVFHVPAEAPDCLVVFAPWVLQGGGADGFLKTTLSALAERMTIIVITTEPVPAGHLSAINDFLDITPYVYHLPGLAPREDHPAIVRSLLYRVPEPAILNMGSPWAYEHFSEIRTWTRGFGPVVDIQFNHIGHVAELLDNHRHIDTVLAASEHLKSLLVDYFELSTDVEVMYVAPPVSEADLPPRVPGSRLRVGWLGRNSPEKRPDLVADIAAATPEVDFVIAGGGFQDFDPPVPNLQVVGFVDDARAFIAECDLLLNTSDTEGIAVSAMEALQCGVPVATRDVGGMTELIVNDHNGFVYDASDITGLVRRLTDPALIASVAKNAEHERLPRQFRVESMVATVARALTQEVPRY
ncbi:MAG: glycosyltransferase [Candidatus Nanopelagicales bacterium]